MNEGWVLESCSQTAVQSGSFRLTLFVGSLVLLGFLLAWNSWTWDLLPAQRGQRCCGLGLWDAGGVTGDGVERLMYSVNLGPAGRGPAGKALLTEPGASPELQTNALLLEATLWVQH